ncbi:MAG: M20/M25/M40 family metallo-hydrolase [Phycisphaerae bacterium]|nr:M20/M25/M40 family metallo-hydrolase [Phycisphaerae bacterium]
MKRIGLVGISLLFLSACGSHITGSGPDRQAISDAETQSLRQDVTYLASDALEGRGVGLPGLNRAADFIADRYRQLGLREVSGGNGYFQPFTYTLNAAVGPRSSLALNGQPLTINRDFTQLPLTAPSAVAAPVVFVGYGIKDSDHRYDDYAGIDVRGKIALAMRYEPHNPTGGSAFTMTTDWSPAAALMTKSRAAADHGAIGLILVNPPFHHGGDLLLAPTMLQAPHASIPVFQVTQKSIESFIDLKNLQSEIDRTSQPASASLDHLTIDARADLITTQTIVKNVIAELPGTGPHAGEFIVIGAHYDHLGRGGPGSLMFGSHAIHHGADDNASGTAAVLALAERLTRAGRLNRSVLFINFTAEEEGLIGSEYFVQHPPIPLSKIVAMINLDMVGRVRDAQLFVGGTGTEIDFDRLLADADRQLPLKLKDSGPYIGRGGFGPSDHMSFAQKSIPVLFFFSGIHADYHRPTDTAEKLNYDGMEAVVTLAHRLVDELADAPREPYDAEFDSQGAMTSLLGGGRRASLGVVPDYGSTDPSAGVRITGTIPGSPAEKAGLRDGDVLIRIGATRLDTLYDLEQFLSDAHPGEAAELHYRRGREDFKSQVTLGERRG